MRGMRRTVGVLVAGMALAGTVMVGPAAADDLYPLNPPPTATPPGNPGVPASTPRPAGTLPLTGGDAAGLAGIGAAMVLGGAVLHRRSRMRTVAVDGD